MGRVSNDGTDNIDYAASIARRTQNTSGQTGPFAGGGGTGSSSIDFDQSYDALNSTESKPANRRNCRL